MLENEHTDRIFLTTCFLWVHIALSVSEQSTSSVLSSQPLLQSITHKIFSNPIPCSKSQLFSSMKENSHEYSLSDLQLSLSLIMNPYHSSVPPSFCSPSLLAPPLPPTPPFLWRAVFAALRLSALFCLKLSVCIQAICLVLKQPEKA